MLIEIERHSTSSYTIQSEFARFEKGFVVGVAPVEG